MNSNCREYQCPRCGSQSTQSVVVAYENAARSSESGFKSISVHGERIAPPQTRDEKFVPGLVCCAAAAFALWKLPGLLAQTKITALQNLTLVDWPVVVLSCAVGWAAGLLFAMPAILHNVRIEGEIEKWGRGIICKRCAYRWDIRNSASWEVPEHDEVS